MWIVFARKQNTQLKKGILKNLVLMKVLCCSFAGLVSAFSCEFLAFQTGAVCVYPARVVDCVVVLKKLESTGNTKPLPIAAVATGFPSGQYSLSTRLEEVRQAVKDGASEIDIVINRTLALQNDWVGELVL